MKNAVTKKYIGFEIEFGCHYFGETESINSGPMGPGAAICRAHEGLFTDSKESESGCGEGLAEFGFHQFRIYLDHLHPEISSPLAEDAKNLVTWQNGAKKLIRACQKRAEKKYGRICIHCGNTNRNGAGWGFHLNILVSRRAFNYWRDQEWRPLLNQWVPFLVSSPILFGTGKIGSENQRPIATYQLSQRADFIDRVSGSETVVSKSLINDRDEPLADAERYARFHITSAFDFNCCEFASWLKFGTSQLLMTLVESGVAMPDLSLKDPLAALETVSRDPDLSASLELSDGSRRTALDIQEALAAAVDRAITNGIISDEIVPSAHLILASWAMTLEQLKRHDPILRRRLDWVLKRHAFDKWRRHSNAEWNDPRLQALDLKYAELGHGWFERLSRNNKVDRLKDFLTNDEMSTCPRSSGRDTARARIIESFHDHVIAANWHSVCLAVPERDNDNNDNKAIYQIRLDDPLDAVEINKALRAAKTARQLVRALPAEKCRKIHCVDHMTGNALNTQMQEDYQNEDYKPSATENHGH